MRSVKSSPLNWIYTIPLRLRSLFRGGVADVDADEELRDYIDRQTEENIRRGMSAEQARRAALVALGGAEQRKHRGEDHRQRLPARAAGDVQLPVQDLAPPYQPGKGVIAGGRGIQQRERAPSDCEQR